MSVFYSQSARGFFDDAIHSTMPGDAVPITGQVHRALIEAQEAGKQIQPDATGYPIAVDPPPPAPPQVVSRFQARAALHLAGLLDQVEVLMSAPETDVLWRLAWTDAIEFRRDSPTLVAMAAALSLTEEQLDQLFITAAGLVA